MFLKIYSEWVKINAKFISLIINAFNCINSQMISKLQKSLIILFIVISCIGCGIKYDLSQKEKSELIKIVDSLYDIDQGSRYKLSIPDSIYGLSEGFYMNLPNVKKDNLGVHYDTYKKSYDNIVDVMKRSDITNTEKLIDITKRYGFPSSERLGVYKAKAYMIFVHSPKIYHPQIEALILEEYKEGRITEYKKEYIFWHLNGRNGLPPMAGKNGEVIWN